MSSTNHNKLIGIGLWIGAIVALFGDVAWAHSGGAPFGSCLTLTPKHGSAPGQPPNTSPYQLSLEFINNNQTGNESILVTIESKGDKALFKGFVVQARFANNPDIIVDGQFIVNEPMLSKTYVCKPAEEIKYNNTWTHRNREWKEKVSAIWTPPEDLAEEIVFVATILKDKSTFWEGQYSSTVTLNAEEEEEESHDEEANNRSLSSSNATEVADNLHLEPEVGNLTILESRDDLNESASNHHKSTGFTSGAQHSGSSSMSIPARLLHSSIILGVLNLLLLSY